MVTCRESCQGLMCICSYDSLQEIILCYLYLFSSPDYLKGKDCTEATLPTNQHGVSRFRKENHLCFEVFEQCDCHQWRGMHADVLYRDSCLRNWWQAGVLCNKLYRGLDAVKVRACIFCYTIHQLVINCCYNTVTFILLNFALFWRYYRQLYCYIYKKLPGSCT